MRKLLYLFIVSAHLAACSSSDESDIAATSPLKKMVQTVYEYGSYTGNVVFEYTDGKMVKATYTAGSEPWGYSTQQFDGDVLISNATYYMNNQLLYSTTFTYNNQGKLVSLYQDNIDFSYTTSYTYNADNTITSLTPHEGGENDLKTFSLNNAGQIYKQQINNFSLELAYEGPNPISSLSSYEGTRTFEYDNTHDPELLHLLDGSGAYLPNAVLRTNFLQDALHYNTTKYLVKETSESEVREYIYTWNEAGLPVKRMDYSNGQLQYMQEYFYE